MGASLDLSLRLPEKLGTLSVLNLGAGYCSSPISCQIPDMCFARLTNVEIWPAYFVKLHAIKFKTPIVENLLEDVEVYLGRLKDEHFDVVLLLDVLEHFDEVVARFVLEKSRQVSDYVVIFLPIGACPQGDLDGNPFQRHASTWQVDDFDGAHVEHLKNFHLHFNPPVDAAWVVYGK